MKLRHIRTRHQQGGRPQQKIFRYLFDPNGRLTNRWTAAKGNTVYRYDRLGNLTNVDYAVSPDLTMPYAALSRAFLIGGAAV